MTRSRRAALICLSIAFIGHLNAPLYAQDKLAKCDKALSLCQDVISAQDHEIVALKGQVKTLEGELKAESAPSVPFWVWLGAGLATGFLGAKLAH